MAPASTTCLPSQEQQQPGQQQQRQQPNVDKVRSLLYRRLLVKLPSGRVIEGDLACLDKQGNLILSNACEHIKTGSSGSPSSSSSSGPTAAAADKTSSKSSSSSSSSSKQPRTSQLGMVLVPKAQQQEVTLKVTLSEKAAMLSLTNGS